MNSDGIEQEELRTDWGFDTSAAGEAPRERSV